MGTETPKWWVLCVCDYRDGGGELIEEWHGPFTVKDAAAEHIFELSSVGFITDAGCESRRVMSDKQREIYLKRQQN